MIQIVALLPLRLLSTLLGWLASIRLPNMLASPIVRLVARILRINIDESAEPIDSFRSTQELFTRKLKPGLRPIHSKLVYPVDGYFRQSGFSSDFINSSVKGYKYELAELLGSMEFAQRCQNGSYVNLYLSPRDYHHVHAPCSMKIVRRLHIPGALWPVNNWALSRVPLLFQKNERVVLEFESEFGAGALVMVGALNVGSMRLEFDNIRTNHPLSWSRRIEVISYPQPIEIEVGGRLGSFLLGSSVLVFFAQPVKMAEPVSGSAVRLGSALNR